MVSDFRKKKLLHVFNFFDRDRSGTIEKNDFEMTIERTTKSRGWAPGDADYKYVSETLLKVWDGISSAGDADGDGKVTQDEWLAMWDVYANNPSQVAEWQNLYCKFGFFLEDSGKDGAIDSEEFSSVMVSFGLNKDDAVAAFQKLSQGKPQVSWAEFQQLWAEYFASEDVNAPGNYIFGRAIV